MTPVSQLSRRTSHERPSQPAVHHARLRQPRRACPARPPTQDHQASRRRRALLHVRRLRQDVLESRSGLGPTGTTAEVSAPHIAVLDTQRESLLPGTGLQPAVSLVPGHGSHGAEFRCDRVHQEQKETPQAQGGKDSVRAGGIRGGQTRTDVG